VKSRFELFIANRYLRAHRKEAAVSIITWISVIGVAAGVMALVIALAVNNGFKNTLERNLLGAMAHINVMERNPTYGIEDWREMSDRLSKIPHVTAVSPALYAEVFLTGSIRGRGAVLKGVDIDAELRTSEALTHLKAGSLARLRDPNAKPPGILVGARLVEQTGMEVGSQITVVSPNEGPLSPLGPRPAIRRFVVAGIYETGFYDIDNLWAYASIDAVQSALSLPSVVNSIELKLDASLAAAPLLLACVAVLASGIPAWRASRAEALAALREQ
jgi:lipoprotein-releasing system permease protein